MDMKLHVMALLQDRVDDPPDDIDAPHQSGHGIDEETALQPMIVQHLHLMDDAEVTGRGTPKDRARMIVLQPRPTMAAKMVR